MPDLNHATVPTALVIRTVGPADYPEIVRLVRDLAEHVGDRSLATVTQESLAAARAMTAPPWHGFAAQVADGTLVGICLYSFIFSTWRGMPGLYIIDLFVDRAQRGAGVGLALLAAAAQAGRAQGCGFMRLEVDHANPTAVGFYEGLGFTEVVHNRTFTVAGPDFAALCQRARTGD